jgi:hypothetical protein
MQPLEFVTAGLLPLVGMLLSFAMVITIVIIVTRSRQRRLEIQAELQGKLIEKFGSSTELVSFLQSETGQRFVRGVQTGNMRLARDRAAGAIRVGIIFASIGTGFLVLWALTGTRGLAWPAVLFLVLGIAYFGTSYVTLRFDSSHAAEPPILPTSSES